MQYIDVKGLVPHGAPHYEMRKIFGLEGNFTHITFTLITIAPGSRVPEEGVSCHDRNEYSCFISGEVYTDSGSHRGMVGEGAATLIPKGESHWCENRSDKPCTLACMMVK